MQTWGEHANSTQTPEAGTEPVPWRCEAAALTTVPPLVWEMNLESLGQRHMAGNS